MSEMSAQGMAFGFWAMLIAGAGMAGFGLIHSVGRYQDWKRAGRDEEGEIVFGDSELQAGQSAWVAPGERALASDSSGVIAATIAELSRKHCVLELDSEALPAPQGNWPTVGAAITVSVTGKTALYRFTARVRDVRPSNSQDHRGGNRIILSRPVWMTRLQRRRHARVDLNLPATFERIWSPVTTGRSSSGDALLQRSAPIHGNVQNLSAGGLRMQIGGVMRLHELDDLLKFFAPETTVRARLPFPALPENALLARVRTCGRVAAPGGLTLQVTCEFLPMPAWEQEIVISHVFQLQREFLRKS